MPDSPAVANQKASLRPTLLAARVARPVGQRVAAAQALAGALVDRLAGARVAGYVPTAEEPGHGRLLGALSVAAAEVLLPVVPATGRELCWAVYDGWLTPGRFGLSEPLGPRLPGSALGAADVVVVPALAVASDGTRLGRGGGYYDRALSWARTDAVLVAVVFDDEMVDRLPAGEHDRRVHAVLTPAGGWRWLDRPDSSDR